MKKYSKRYIAYLIIILLGLSISFASTILAKYKIDNDLNGTIKPTPFYLGTNYVDKETYEIYTEEITLILSNYYLNVLTEEEITYTITVKENGVIKDNLTKSGTIPGNIEYQKEEKISVDFDKLYEVTIQSSEPYIKTITHYFKTFSAEIESFYTLSDKRSWIELDLYIGTTVPSSITINYLSSLSADNTNDLLKNWYGTSGVISGSNLNNNSHYKIIFFKNDSSVYNNIQKGLFVTNGNNFTINITK